MRTMDQLSETKDLYFVLEVLNSKLNKLSNQYTPLANKLKRSISTIEYAIDFSNFAPDLLKTDDIIRIQNRLKKKGL